MMRTEDEIRQALHQRERDASHAADVLPRLQLDVSHPQHSRGRTSLLVAAACVAVAGVVTSTMFVAGRHSDRSGATPSPKPTVTSSVRMPLGPKFEFSFTMGSLPSGLSLVKQVIDPGFQWAEIGWKQPPGCDQHPLISLPSNSSPPDCWPGDAAGQFEDGYALMADVLVFDKGRFDPAVMKNATPVDVNGAHGLLANVVPVNDTVKGSVASVMDVNRPPELTTVAWQYGPDSWAVVAWRNKVDANARDQALKIARATRIGDKHAARVPFEVDYLPAVVDRRWELTSSESGSSGVGFGSARSTYRGDRSGIPERSLPISVQKYTLTELALTELTRIPGDVSLTVSGHAAVYSPKRPALMISCGTGCTLVVGYLFPPSHHLPGSIGKAELVKIAEHITLAPSLTDPSTWFDAATALPH